MAKTTPLAQITYDHENQCYRCIGAWSVLKLDDLVGRFDISNLPEKEKIAVNGHALTDFDSSGALALMHCTDLLRSQGKQIEFKEFTKEQKAS